jgi:hypothetical protein
MMLSSRDTVPATDNVELKALMLSAKWTALYAGSPTFAKLVLNRASAAMKGRKGTLEEAREVMLDAYEEEVSKQIERRFLSRYKMTIQEFRKRGRREFGETEFAILNRPIREYDPRTQFLVCGIDEHDQPHIFTIAALGTMIDNDGLSHAAIGSGAQMALGALGNRQLGGVSKEELIYRVCEAKFSAHTAGGVGTSTICVVHRKGFEHKIWGVQTRELFEIWERTRKDPAPEDAVELIKNAFSSKGVFMNS